MNKKNEVIEKLIKAKNLIIEANEIATSNDILEDTSILNASCDIDEVLGELGVELTITPEEHRKILEKVFGDDPTVTIGTIKEES